MPNGSAPESLAGLLARAIARDGPMGLDQFMALSLSHPRLGYYAGHTSIGADFTTAPEISQMFGELIGLWALEVWRSMGAPDPVRLVELGPGRGALMADALRAAARHRVFARAARIHLVETSPTLREVQRAALSGDPAWHEDLGQVPGGPMILIANEFFDALPIRQYEATPAGWRERLIGVDAAGAFRLVRAASPSPRAVLECRELPPPAEGAVAEISATARALAAGIAGRLALEGGAALIVDYGTDAPLPRSTLRALAAGADTDPFAEPGAADLSAYVDFAALACAARGAGARVHGPVDQGVFLTRLGIGARASALGQKAEATRLVGVMGGAMGTVYKALCLTHPDLPPPPGFES